VRRGHEARELIVGHLGAVHPVTVHVDTMNRHRVGGNAGIAAQGFRADVGSHGEFTAGNPHHVVGRRRGRRLGVDDRGEKMRAVVGIDDELGLARLEREHHGNHCTDGHHRSDPAHRDTAVASA
jgi:hypothetical protein